MKITNQISRVIILTIITVFLFGCGTTKNNFDDKVPQERIASIKYDSGLILKSYNGIEVKPKTGFLGLSYTGFSFPAGSTTLVFDLKYRLSTGNGSVTYTAKDIEVKYNFEAGKEYLLRFWWSDNEGNIQKTNWGSGSAGIHICYADDFYKYLHKIPLSF